jgi:predicted lipid-binding transport protein (Tim44 family)
VTGLVVLLLVVLWIGVLAPRAIRHFKESRSESSIDDFHQQLHLLERAGPKLVEPAYRLAAGDGEVGDALQHSAASSGGRPDLVLLDPDVGPTRSTQPMVRTTSRRSAGAMRRARRRRRDVLLGAVATAVLTGVLGAMHQLHLLWAVTAVSVLAIAAYVALVAYAQMLLADRNAARPVIAAAGTAPGVGTWESAEESRRPPLPLHVKYLPPEVAARRPPRPRHAPGGARPVGGRAARPEGVTSTVPVAVRGGRPVQAWERDTGQLPRHAAIG